MKTITVNIEDDLYEKLKGDAGLTVFAVDCVGVSTADRCMVRIISGIEKGTPTVNLSFTKGE